MYNKKYLFLIAFILLNLLVKSQTIEVTGKITDQEKGEPIPFVNIQVKGSKYGTISNDNGYFSLKIPIKLIKNNIVFSYIGYEPQELIIEKENKNLKVFLSPTDFLLGEVIIMPDSTLLTLLEKAYKKIPYNYSMFPTTLKGFYRELIKTSHDKYLYFAEAVTETYKSSYDIRSDYGQVKILKSLINEFPDIDSLRVRFYGGLFKANEGDFVKKREDFINPGYFKNYNYSLQGITKLNGNEVYIICFDTRNDSLNGTKKGKFYIEKSSLAYVGCECEDTDRGLKKYNDKALGIINAMRSTTNVSYFKYNDKWHIKYITHERIFKERHPTIFKLNNEYMSTEILTDSVKPIPFGERLEFADIFSEKARSYYSEDYWEEYNILKKDSSLDNQLKLLYDTIQSKILLTKKSKTKKKSFKKILSKLSIQYGMSYYPIHAEKGSFNINYNGNNNSFSLSEELSSFQYSINILGQFNYDLNYRWSLNFAVQESLSKKINIETYDIGASYHILLNKRTKPLILNLSLTGSFNSFSRNFSTYTNATDFEFGNKNVDAEKLQFSIGFKTIGIKPQIGLEYNLRRMLWLTASVGYYVPFYSGEKLFLQEKSGFFLARKKANISLTDNSLEVTHNGLPTNKSQLNFDNYSLSLGFMVKF